MGNGFPTLSEVTIWRSRGLGKKSRGVFTPLEQRFTPPPPEGPDYILPLESRCVPTCDLYTKKSIFFNLLIKLLLGNWTNPNIWYTDWFTLPSGTNTWDVFSQFFCSLATTGLYSCWEYKGKRGEHIQSTLTFGVIHLVHTQAGGEGGNNDVILHTRGV